MRFEQERHNTIMLNEIGLKYKEWPATARLTATQLN